MVWKERNPDGSIETSVLIPIDKYIADLEDAFNKGTKSK